MQPSNQYMIAVFEIRVTGSSANLQFGLLIYVDREPRRD